MSDEQSGRVDGAMVDGYTTLLVEPSRPPSRGGNTSAMHSHRLTIAGVAYSFLARGAKKWVFKGDSVSFDWHWDASRCYRNIQPATLVTQDRSGSEIVRGDRRSKPKLRTAISRMPASGREQRG